MKMGGLCMIITVCIGSACHIKGSSNVVDELQKLVSSNHLGDTIELCGSFCMSNCSEGVCVKIDEDMFSLKPENIESFFTNEVLKRL